MAGSVKRKIVLSDGSEYSGEGFGFNGDKVCELVFNTAMVGIQEMITDPVYLDKIVVLSYPVVGCYGINDDDYQSRSYTPSGIVVRKYCDEPSNFRCTASLSEVMEDNRMEGLSGVDTRALIRTLREKGNCLAMITDADTPTEKALEAIRDHALELRPVERVSCKKRWYSRPSKPEFNVAVIDCGARNSDIKNLKKLGCNLIVLPFNVAAEQVRAVKPDGIYISDGPGDPQQLNETIELIRQIRGELPICGSGLGFLLICLACGGETFKLKTSVYGGNHPVKELKRGKIATCTQNRDYGVVGNSLEGAGLLVTHVDVIDGSVQGVSNAKDRIFGVQYVSGYEGESYKTLFQRLKDSMREAGTNG